MLPKLTNFLTDFLLKGHARSVKAKKNIIGSFAVKGIVILINFVRVPIIISYLNSDKYGIWLTIASIVMWVQYFDLGIGSGLRNKFAQAIAHKDHDRAKKLVSTAYYYITIIFSGIGVILIPVILILDWQSILNTTKVPELELMYSVLFVLLMFIARFIFKLISVILKADQRPALSDVFLPIGSVISLLLILGLKYFSKDSLLLACIVISIPPVLTLAISNIYFFNTKYKRYRPSIKWVDKSVFKDIFSLGMKFFYIQLASLVLFSGSNMILIQLVGPEEVTIFNITRQYFGIPMMVFTIMTAPFWSATTEAFALNELKWIKNVMRRYRNVAFLLSAGALVMLFLSPFVYKIWLGSLVKIPFQISVIMCIYNIAALFLIPFSGFINGVGKLKLGLRIVTFKIIAFLPVAISLTKILGATGLILALLLINLIPNIYFEIKQYNLIINNRATGIWNK